MNNILVIIPTYNEAENLTPIVRRLQAAVDVDILVVDDDSPDGTGHIADQLASDDPHLHVLHRPSKQGLGAAYLDGFAWGLERDYDLLVEMDADGSHAPEQLPQLLAASEQGADLVLGSRWISGGDVLDWPWHRRLLSRAGTQYARLMLGLRIHDITGGYRVFRRETLHRLRLDDVSSQGYCFQIDIARRVVAGHMSVVEVPITFAERKHGKSKMTGAIVREALLRVTLWGIQRRTRGPSRTGNPSSHQRR